MCFISFPFLFPFENCFLLNSNPPAPGNVSADVGSPHASRSELKVVSCFLQAGMEAVSLTRSSPSGSWVSWCSLSFSFFLTPWMCTQAFEAWAINVVSRSRLAPLPLSEFQIGREKRGSSKIFFFLFTEVIGINHRKCDKHGKTQRRNKLFTIPWIGKIP